MGTNESFPPPPPPGQHPPVAWPQQPAAGATQQVPTTQMYPQQGAPAGGGSGKRGNGMLIGGGLVVAAALIAGVVLFTGGDDDAKPSITLAPVSSTTAVPETTAFVQITTPPTVASTAPATDPTTADDGLITVTDDTGTFSILLPDDLEFDTTTITSTDGFEVPSVSAAEGIANYNVDDTTFGVTAVVVGPDIGSDAAQVMAFLEPVEGTCTGRSEQFGVATAVGPAHEVTLTGCGVGAGNKVLLAVQLPDRPFVLGLYLQGLAAIEDLRPAAYYGLESIVVF